MPIARALEESRGWVEYRWYSPWTDRLAPKIAWFVRVGRYVVGVGAYPKAGVQGRFHVSKTVIPRPVPRGFTPPSVKFRAIATPMVGAA